MKYLIYLLLLIILTGFSAGLAPFMEIRGQVPNVLFLLALVWSFEKDDEDFLVLALVCGLFLDFYSGKTVGSLTLPPILTCLAARLSIQNFLAFELRLKHLVVLLVPAQALYYALYFFTGWLFSRAGLGLEADLGNLAQGFVIALLYNALLLYPISLLVNYVRYIISRYVEREYKAR